MLAPAWVVDTDDFRSGLDALTGNAAALAGDACVERATFGTGDDTGALAGDDDARTVFTAAAGADGEAMLATFAGDGAEADGDARDAVVADDADDADEATAGEADVDELTDGAEPRALVADDDGAIDDDGAATTLAAVPADATTDCAELVAIAAGICTAGLVDSLDASTRGLAGEVESFDDWVSGTATGRFFL